MKSFLLFSPTIVKAIGFPSIAIKFLKPPTGALKELSAKWRTAFNWIELKIAIKCQKCCTVMWSACNLFAYWVFILMSSRSRTCSPQTICLISSALRALFTSFRLPKILDTSDWKIVKGSPKDLIYLYFSRFLNEK